MRSQDGIVTASPAYQTAEPSDGQQAHDSLFHQIRMGPRPYQWRIVGKALDMFAGRHVNRFGHQEPPARSVLIESPTGSGKTVMGLLIAKALHSQYGLRIGWVAMRRNLLAQAAAENVRRGFGL